MTRQAAAARSRGQNRSKRREQEVLDAAVEIFNRQGYADTSVEDIANALGILKGSLYYYIDSKEDLLYKIVAEVHADVQRCLDEALAHADAPPLERLRMYIVEQVRYNAANVAKISVYYQDLRRLTGERLDDIRRRRRAQERAVIGLIEEAQERGDIPSDMKPALASHCVFATIIWPYTWYRQRGAISRDELARACADYALRGIGAQI
jgi:TetR/AcrR family transcriptional regulator, cholesterol catabolism regulator